MAIARVTRDVSSLDPHNHTGRDVLAGETWFVSRLPDYGAIDWRDGIGVTEADGEYPAYELPRDAVEVSES